MVLRVDVQRQFELPHSGRKLADAHQNSAESAVALLGGRIKTHHLCKADLGCVEIAAVQRGQSIPIGMVGLLQHTGLGPSRK